MTTTKAKKLVKDFLDENQLPYTRLRARTISFEDPNRDERVFVEVHGWLGSEMWKEILAFAIRNKFNVTAIP